MEVLGTLMPVINKEEQRITILNAHIPKYDLPSYQQAQVDCKITDHAPAPTPLTLPSFTPLTSHTMSFPPQAHKRASCTFLR